MKKTFDQHLKGFKWEFGNPAHIRALDMLEAINKKKKLVKEKLKNQKVIKNQLDEIKRHEGNLLFTLGIDK